MADQVGSGMVAGHAAEGGQLSPAAAGGPATLWWLFWVGVAMCAVGGLLALATHIFEDWY